MDQQHPQTPVYDRTIGDVGNIVEFGHVNVLIPDQQLATLFYVSALGFTRDPYLMTSTDNMWINVGQQQFHLPTGRAQVVRGVTGIVIPDLAPLRRRLERIGQKLGGTKYSVTDLGDAVEVTCPWGNRIRLHAPAQKYGPVALGTVYVELAAPVGGSAAIVKFYNEILDAPAQAGEDAGGRFVSVGTGMNTRLLYRETDAPQPAYDGNHIQITLADFSGPHKRLLERGLITEESDDHQYQFVAVTDLDSGRVLVEIEHEVRSMRHPLFNRQLVNRNPLQSNREFAPQREAWAWSAPLE